MQDIHSIGGANGALFGGAGDRRLRPHQHQAATLKCPRCDSLNTKFCYYNNYNLSQPRHFCKSCRRYWTKGGVLRNVPIGGGCRKAKRSNKSKTSSSGDQSTKSSTSENSIITAATTAEPPLHAVVTAVNDTPNVPNLCQNTSGTGSGFEGFGEMGSTFMMGSGNEGTGTGFGFGPMVDYGTLDWQSGGGDQGLFDLTDTVDHAYWSQSGDHQWSDQVQVQDDQQNHHHQHPTDLYNFP